MVEVHPNVEYVMLTDKQITKRVRAVAKQLDKLYEGRKPVVVCILKGSVVFFSDLIRNMKTPLTIDFMSVSSYGNGVKSSGVVKIVKDLDINLEGKDILIVEDILDSGKTLHHLRELLSSRNPKSFKICTLLDKPERREADISADYSGFSVPNEFVVGYGLDFNEEYRNIPFVGVLKPEVYSE